MFQGNQFANSESCYEYQTDSQVCRIRILHQIIQNQLHFLIIVYFLVILFDRLFECSVGQIQTLKYILCGKADEIRCACPLQEPFGERFQIRKAFSSQMIGRYLIFQKVNKITFVQVLQLFFAKDAVMPSENSEITLIG